MQPTSGKPCTSRECMLGLHMLHFPPSRTVHCFAVVFGLFLTSWCTFYSVWRACRRPSVRIAATLAITIYWAVGWYYLQPRYPYWINELSLTTYVLSTWHLLDWVTLRLHETIPKEVSLGSLLMDDALVLRPYVLRHRVGYRQPTGRSLVRRVRESLPFLGMFTLQYCGCETLNAWLMQQSTEAVLHGPFLYRLTASLSFAAALYFHLSYFSNIMAFLNIVAFDRTPEDWPPPFTSPWSCPSPGEFWNTRWHQMFRHWFVRLVFKPTRQLLIALLHHTWPQHQPTPDKYTAAAAATAAGAHEQSTRTPGKGHKWLEAVTYQTLAEQQPTGSQESSSRALAGVDGASGEAGSGGAPRNTPMRRSSRLAAATGAGNDMSAASPAAQSSTLRRRRSSSRGPADSRQLEHNVNAGVPGRSARGRAANQGSHLIQATGGRQAADPDTKTGTVARTGADTHRPAEADAKRAVSRHLLVQTVPVLAVFVASGLFHEQMNALFFGKTSGEQLVFFLVHGIVVLAERGVVTVTRDWARKPPRWLAVAVFNCFLAWTSILFFKPWFRSHYHRELRVPVPGPVHFAVAEWSRHPEQLWQLLRLDSWWPL